MDNNNYPNNLPGQEPGGQMPGGNKYEKYKAEQELTKVIAGSNETLATATTVFPFTLFPDTVTVDRTKISITKRSFFQVAEVISIRIEDILNVAANIGPFFGSLRISTRFFDGDQHKPYSVNWLNREDTLRIKRVVHGYLAATKQRIDMSALTTAELAKMLDELGKGAEESA